LEEILNLKIFSECFRGLLKRCSGPLVAHGPLIAHPWPRKPHVIRHCCLQAIVRSRETTVAEDFHAADQFTHELALQYSTV